MQVIFGLFSQYKNSVVLFTYDLNMKMITTENNTNIQIAPMVHHLPNNIVSPSLNPFLTSVFLLSTN